MRVHRQIVAEDRIDQLGMDLDPAHGDPGGAASVFDDDPADNDSSRPPDETTRGADRLWACRSILD
jgi:hypothetical protein